MNSRRLSEHVLRHDGIERHYWLYVPASYLPSTPLLIVLHGGGGKARGMIQLTRGGFNDLADRDGFFVAYPDGVGRHWNDGRPLRGRHSDADDVGFLAALIEQLGAQYPLDHKRVYVTGISNGGHMAYRLACELSDRIAGIAPVSALMPQAPGRVCAPSLPVAVLIIAGMDDPLVPYNGGEVRIGILRRGSVLSADETVRFWAAANNCDEHPVITELPDRDPSDGTRIRETRYNGGDAPVVLYTVEGGGHTWAGGLQYLGERMIGRTSREIDANTVIWEFFKSLSNPA